MRIIKYIIFLILFILSLPIWANVPLLNPQINISTSHDGSTFSQEVELPFSNNIRIRIPDVAELHTSNIAIQTPSGDVINQDNANSFNASFYYHQPQNKQEQFFGLVNSWIITLNNVPEGKFIISGNVSGTNDVPINIEVVDSPIKFALFIGEPNKRITNNSWTPISLYLTSPSSKYTDASVHYQIFKDGNLLTDKIVKDDGLDTDLVSSDGLYTLMFKPDTTGVYTVKMAIKNIDDSNLNYSFNIQDNFEVDSSTIVIDKNYIEEVNDTNSNGFNDELIISFPILDSTVSEGYFSVYAKLKSAEGDVLEDFRRIEITENKIYVKFNGSELRELNYSGSYHFEKFHLKYIDTPVIAYENLRDTSYYPNSTWERSNLIYADSFTDEPIDLNNDGIYDQIRITFDVDSILSGNYGLSTHAITELNIETDVLGVPSFTLNEGLNTIELIVGAADFSALGEKTNLTFKNLFIYPLFNADALLEVDHVGTTNVYDCWYFAGCTNGPNTPPIAVNDTAYTDGQTVSINAASNDIDDDGDLIKVNAITQPINGTATIVGNAIHYTPNETFEGHESFEYEILDVHPVNNVWKRGKDTGVITVTVLRNAPPIANDDTFDVAVDGEAQLPVLDNDTDADGDRLYINEVTSPENGTLTNYGHIIVYKPNAGFSGIDTFEYTIVDVDVDTNVAKGGVDTATVTLNVGTITNTAPTAVNDEFSVEVGEETILDVIANDYDMDGDSVYIVEYSLPIKGSIDAVDNKFIYTSYSDATGQDSFVYKITDTKGGEAIAEVTLYLLQTGSAPVSNDDYVTTSKNTSASIEVLTNDEDPNNESIFIVSFTQPSNGIVTNSDDILNYQPNQDFTGDDSFTYTISNTSGYESTSSVFITVTNTNSLPTANDDHVTTNLNNPISIDVLANDSDPDGDSLRILSVTSPSNGQVEILGSNIVYTPNELFTGNDQFGYTITDDISGEANATVSVSVVDDNLAPVAENDYLEIFPGETIVVDVLSNDFDPNGDPLNLISVAPVEFGEASIVNNKIQLTVFTGFLGTYSFSYSISDGTLESSAMVTVNIKEPLNQSPTLRIESPMNSQVFLFGDAIHFSGTANDPEDGDISGNIHWESNLDGSLGIGQHVTAVLSVGDHIITATITDSNDNTVSNSIDITVEPLNGTEFTNSISHNIPDNKGYGVVSSINVPVELDATSISVYADIVHDSSNDISIQLISPAGKHYNLVNPGQYSPGQIWTLPLDKVSSKGIWSLKVSDQKKGVVGTLDSWRIKFE
ncbi:Ig-like domain-containing protein [Kangiella koreensis]|uniref:Proprotein convertase P n=1 Tax=Kangiella koreensis (strain DSM 16069 / JCM 12317 / KCTC 12182 / SW-125) TaxID=523791 RepID=C7R630_KANKD|nr:Ig-like domain-containing protein [Kangiella koreensis]ACV25461.1 Proprotein convertase P [Kangiella koreensis DSM 16069]